MLSCVKPRPAHLERMSGLPLPVSTTTVTTTITVFTCLHFHRRHYHLYLRYHGPLSKLPSPLSAPSSSLSHISSSGLPSPHRHLTLLNAGLLPLICTSTSFLYVHLPLPALTLAAVTLASPLPPPPVHYGLEQPRIETEVLGHSLVGK